MIVAMAFFGWFASDERPAGLAAAAGISASADALHAHDSGETAEQSHHHGDHSHEKVSLSASLAFTIRAFRDDLQQERSLPLKGLAPGGPERPPRPFRSV